MHATTSPAINQPRIGGFRAFGAVVGLAAAIAAGAVIGVATAPTATVAPPAGLTDESVKAIQPNPATRGGSLTRAQRIVREQRLARLYRVVQAGDQMRYWHMHALQRGLGIGRNGPAGEDHGLVVGPIYRPLPLYYLTPRQMIEPRLPGLLGDAIYVAISAEIDPGDDTPRGLSHR